MVKGETYNKQLFESEAFRHFINVFTNKESGVTQGCEITKDTQNITVEKGYFFIQGGLLRETTGTANAIPNEAGYYKLVYEIDLSKTNAKDVFNQGSYKFIKALGDYPSLTQEDLDDGGTIYQLPFCQFRVTENGIEDFLDVRKFVEYGIYEMKGTVLYENEEGTTGNVQLSDTTEKYEYLEVFWNLNDTVYGSNKIEKPNKKVFQITTNTNPSNLTRAWSQGNTINGKIIERGECVFQDIGGNRKTANFMKITKVIGYKD